MNKLFLKFFPLLITVLLLISYKNHEETKYIDLIKNLNIISKKTDKFIIQINNAKSSKRILILLKKYADDMEKLIPLIYRLEKKYPELDYDTPVYELKKAYDNFENSISKDKTSSASKKISEYADQNNKIKFELERINSIFYQNKK